MPQDPPHPAPVRVAIAAVVENMSSLQVTSPPHTDLDALRNTTLDALRVMVTLRGGRVLAGYWELPGGKVEADESIEEALVRELQEEVGITVEPLTALPAVRHAYAHGVVCLLPFICRRITGTPRAIEVDEVRWVTLDELSALRMPEASVPVVRALRHGLSEVF